MAQRLYHGLILLLYTLTHIYTHTKYKNKSFICKNIVCFFPFLASVGLCHLQTLILFIDNYYFFNYLLTELKKTVSVRCPTETSPSPFLYNYSHPSPETLSFSLKCCITDTGSCQSSLCPV